MSRNKFHASTSDLGCHNGGDTVDANVVITATGSSSGRYGRLWRRSITVGILISVKKTTSFHEENSLQFPSKSPSSSSPCITHKTGSNSSQQEDPVLNVHHSFSTKSFKGQEAPRPGLSRHPSARSQHVVDIRDDEQKNEIVQIVQSRDLIALKRIGGVEKVASVFDSDLDKGICESEIEIESQVAGNNDVNGFFHFLLEASRSYTIVLLLVSAGLSFTTEIIEQGLRDGWHDGIAILGAVFMLVMCKSIANYRRARNLGKNENYLGVDVVRRGLNRSIFISNLKEGDLVSLKEGDRVPGDGMLVNGDGLVLDDKITQEIDFDKNPFLFYGSKVRQGGGSMLVVSVGGNTELGKGSRMGIQDFNETKLIEAQIKKPNTYIENFSLFVSVLIALAAFVRLLCRKHDGIDSGIPELKGEVSVDKVMNMLEILLIPEGRVRLLAGTLMVVVIALQHGMPFVFTISLSYWNEKVLEIKKAEPQNLLACTTMGITTVICIDASSGLIYDCVEVNKFWVGEEDVTKNDVAISELNPVIIEALERAIRASILVSETSVSPTYNFLISWAKSRWNTNVELLDQHLSVLDYMKLSTNNKVYGILLEHKGDDNNVLHTLHTHWSGAASTILQMCSHYYDSNGEIHAIGNEAYKFRELIKDMEESGLRPVAFACKQTRFKEIEKVGLHLLALAGLKYSCTKEIKSSIEALRDSGVKIILISDEEFSAVRAIACDLGICKPEKNDLALEGEEFRDLSTEEGMKKLNETKLMGSCLRRDKLLVVKNLQQEDHIVAFFGGLSTNDVPALKQADLAITVDGNCTDIARESSDIVLLEKDSFTAILKVGRCAYHNIQRFSQLQLTVCMSGLLISLITSMCLDESPITAVQLIWVNWITCLLGGLMMVKELRCPRAITANPSANRTQSLITKSMWRDTLIQVLSQVFVFLVFQFKGKFIIPTMENEIQKAIIFSSFTLCQILNQFNAMELVNKQNLLVVLKHYYFLMALGSVLAIQVLIVDFAKSLANGSRLNGIHWIICFLLAALPWVIHCAVNFLLNSECSVGSPSGVSRRQPWPHYSSLFIPFSIFLFFSLTYY